MPLPRPLVGYWSDNQQFQPDYQCDLVPSTTQTASGNGDYIDLGSLNTAELTVAVTAASGTTPTLAVTIQTSRDLTTWLNVGSYGQVSAVGSQMRPWSMLSRYVRAVWTIGGTTPSFTFSVTGKAK